MHGLAYSRRPGTWARVRYGARLMLRRCALPLLVLLQACPAPPVTPDGGSADGGASWRVVQRELPGALLSAWESDDGVLYAVGGSASRALVLRHDADGWWQMDPGTTRALWWVHGFSANDVYAVGAAGVVTHFDGTRWTVEREAGAATLFGVFGPSAETLVAVGGVVTSSAPKPVVLRRTAGGWSEVPALPATDTRPLFKVWGRSASDLFIVGERGLIGHGAPEALTFEASRRSDRLTTISGNATETVVVGGLQRPVMLRRVDGQWAPVEVPGAPQLLNGVAVNAQGQAVIVGLDGYLAEGPLDQLSQTAPVTDLGLHAVISTRAGFVAVGGDLVQTLGRGVVLARGALAAGAPRSWPHAGVGWDAGLDGGADAGRFDAGVPDGGVMDAGVADAGEGDAGAADAGAADAGSGDAGSDGGSDAGPSDGGTLGHGDDCSMEPSGCIANTTCWFVFGPFKSFCAATCTDVGECSAYGAGACCRLPGPQAMENVCLTASVCDGGGA